MKRILTPKGVYNDNRLNTLYTTLYMYNVKKREKVPNYLYSLV